MSILDDVVARRRQRWIDCLTDYRYSVGQLPGTRKHGDVEVALRAEFSDSYTPPRPVIEVEEIWRIEAGEPDGLSGTADRGCVLIRARWHAQVYGAQPDASVGAMRIDLKRCTSKPPLHMHPLGAPNKEFKELTSLPEIESWVADVEQARYEILLDCDP